MTDLTRDPFEARLAAALQDYVAGAHDPRSAAAIADVAMRPRGVTSRLRGASRSRRVLYFAVAAVLLVPTAYFGGRLLLPTPPSVNQLPPPLATPAATPSPNVPQDQYRAIVARRSAGSPGGLVISAVRPDGAERVLREIPDSILPARGTISDVAEVSSTGWLALSDGSPPHNMILVDLRDPQSVPWVVPGISLDGGNPAWGPQGYVAAPVSLSSVVIVDPATQQKLITLTGGLLGGGAAIWAADGSGLVDRQGDSTYGVLPIDGSPFRPGTTDVFRDSHGWLGDQGTSLRVCFIGNSCPTADGSVELVGADGSLTTIWQQTGADRAVDADFGDATDEYLLQLEADAGRQIKVVQVGNSSTRDIGSIDRPAAWRFFTFSGLAPDKSLMTFFVVLGNNITYGTAIAPVGGGTPTFHQAQLAGYLTSAIADSVGPASYDFTSTQPVGAPATAAYQLESIAAETAPNTGRVVAGQGWADAVEADSGIQSYQITAVRSGDLDVYVDCFGPTPVTLTYATYTVTNPCIGQGSYPATFYGMRAGDVATVTAARDTSWRAVLYTFDGGAGPVDTPTPGG